MDLQVTPHSWQSIESLYVSLNEHGWGHDHLLTLVRHIQSSGLSQRLFAVSSLDALVISSYAPFEFGHETLHIKFDRSDRTFIFNY